MSDVARGLSPDGQTDPRTDGQRKPPGAGTSREPAGRRGSRHGLGSPGGCCRSNATSAPLFPTSGSFCGSRSLRPWCPGSPRGDGVLRLHKKRVETQRAEEVAWQAGGESRGEAGTRARRAGGHVALPRPAFEGVAKGRPQLDTQRAVAAVNPTSTLKHPVTREAPGTLQVLRNRPRASRVRKSPTVLTTKKVR